MTENMSQPGEANLNRLLRSARPTAELPPGFQNAVWRRIESSGRQPAGLLERLAGLFLMPRFAAATLAAVVLFAGAAGVLSGIRTGERQARDRYIASVDPSYLPH